MYTNANIYICTVVIIVCTGICEYTMMEICVKESGYHLQ